MKDTTKDICQNLLDLDIKMIPEIDNEDFLYFLQKINANHVTERMMAELDVRPDTQNYHKELYNKIKHFISKEKERVRLNKEPTFFTDKPMFNIKDLHNYVIILGTPFVEKAKQDKFRQYLTTKSILTDFAVMVKEIIFPYEDNDKEKLEKNALVVVRFGSIEEARLVRMTIDGKHIMKNNIATALLYEEYLQIFFNKEEDSLLNKKVEESHSWEDQTLEELLLTRGSENFQLYSFHYLKKFCEPCDRKHEIKTNYSVEWSPNGTYLIQNNQSSLEFYTGNTNLEKVFELPENCQSFIMSNDENYVVSFLGLGNTNLITDSEYIKDIITRQNVFIWDILGRSIIKSIKISNEENFNNFKFSDDSKFLGRLKNDTLIIYEAPDFKMLLDTSNNKRHPLTDRVSKFYWFPGRNYLMTIQEIRKHKQIDSILEFYQIPSRRKCDLSIPFTNVQVVSFKWHPNNKILMLLLKAINSPSWSIRIVEFNFNNFSHKSKSYEILKPIVRTKKDETITEKDIDFNSVDAFWVENGNDIMVVAKKRLLIPFFSNVEKKYITTDNGCSVNLIFYSFSLKDIKLTSWPEDKNNKNFKFDSVEVSSTGKSFILYNKRFEERDSYGEAHLYSIDDGNIHEITKLSFGDKFYNIKFDQSGRFFAIELSRVSMENYESKGARIFYISGEPITEIKDNTLREVRLKLYLLLGSLETSPYPNN